MVSEIHFTIIEARLQHISVVEHVLSMHRSCIPSPIPQKQNNIGKGGDGSMDETGIVMDWLVKNC